MMPIITPWVRSRRVMARVSTPLMPSTPWDARNSSTVAVLSEWLGWMQCWRTTKPET